MVSDFMHVEILSFQMVVGLRKNVVLFVADVSYLGLIDNKNKDILILERPADGLDDITLTEVNKCYTNFPKQQRILCIIMR